MHTYLKMILSCIACEWHCCLGSSSSLLFFSTAARLFFSHIRSSCLPWQRRDVILRTLLVLSLVSFSRAGDRDVDVWWHNFPLLPQCHFENIEDPLFRRHRPSFAPRTYSKKVSSEAPNGRNCSLLGASLLAGPLLFFSFALFSSLSFVLLSS